MYLLLTTMLSDYLSLNEFIIMEVWNRKQNECHLTNKCNILYIDKPSRQVKRLECNDNIFLHEKIIKNIANHKFKSSHYSDLKKEIIAYLEIASKYI